MPALQYLLGHLLEHPELSHHKVSRTHLANNDGRDIVAVREKFAQYFMSEAGRVPWQDNI